MKTSAELKRQAKDALRGKWGTVIAILLIMALLQGGINVIPVVGTVVALLIGAQLTVGQIRFFTCAVRGEEAGVGTVFQGFHKFFGNFITSFLVGLYTGLWSLLFFIPGLIKSFSYAMTMFLKAKNPELRANEAITLSRKMMNGNKWRLFCLSLSFIGWFILSILTLGILLIYVLPYLNATMAAFYEDVYEEYQKNNA